MSSQAGLWHGCAPVQRSDAVVGKEHEPVWFLDLLDRVFAAVESVQLARDHRQQEHFLPTTAAGPGL